MKFSGSLLEAEKKKALYEIIGIPFDGNAFKKGAKEGPKAIRRASKKLETFLWEKKSEISQLLFYDRGDIKIEERGIKSYEKIYNSFLREEKEWRWKGCNSNRIKKIFIGGDHSISFPIIKFIAKNVSSEGIKVISIDAHTDFRDIYKGKKYSNACVMRRIAELVNFENLIEIGIRSTSEEEYTSFKNKLRIYDAAMLKKKGIDFVLGEIGKEKMSEREKTYLSIDIDVLDPGIAPGVENPEPCGLNLKSLILLIRGLMERNDVIGCDIVEVNPKMDFNEITSINAARIIFEILVCWEEREREIQ